jgi:UDP-glucose 4-epimerase
MRALVTGGAGFIGSHLTDTLLARGDDVLVVDHLEQPKGNLDLARAQGARVVRADVTQLAVLRNEFRAFRPQTVYHLAAQIDVRRSVEDPSGDAHVNVGGTAAVLTAALDAGVERVVLASTAGVYGDPRQIPTPEDAGIAPLSPYGAGKAAAESYMDMFSRLHGLSTVSLRMANVYGPRQSPHGEAGVIAIFCGAAVSNTPVTVFGDGGQTRDFVYVGDVVEAFARAGRSDVRGALNICTGRETALHELVGKLGLRSEAGAGRLGEIRRSCLAPTAAAAHLGWTAQTGLAEGLEWTLAWLGQQGRAARAE